MHATCSGAGDAMLLSSPAPQVPKMLGLLVHSWAPGAMHISFKLETDPSILINKAGMG